METSMIMPAAIFYAKNPKKVEGVRRFHCEECGEPNYHVNRPTTTPYYQEENSVYPRILHSSPKNSAPQSPLEEHKGGSFCPIPRQWLNMN